MLVLNWVSVRAYSSKPSASPQDAALQQLKQTLRTKAISGSWQWCCAITFLNLDHKLTPFTELQKQSEDALQTQASYSSFRLFKLAGDCVVIWTFGLFLIPVQVLKDLVLFPLLQSQAKKVSIITKLLAACQDFEAKYTVLVALAHAAVLAKEHGMFHLNIVNEDNLSFVQAGKRWSKRNWRLASKREPAS
jgi:hypothetical protein